MDDERVGVLVFFTGKVCLTFFGQWSEVQSEINSQAMEQMYCAPGKADQRCNLPPSGKKQCVFLGGQTLFYPVTPTVSPALANIWVP